MLARMCTVDGCERPARSRGYCDRHYKRMWRHGDVAGVRHIVGAPEERFWFFANRRGPNDCWEWSGNRRQGYGRLRIDGRLVPAHRFAYELLVGPIPDGYEPDHLCRNPGCVNPAHLEPVTHQENCRRGLAGAHLAIRTHCPWGHEYTPENTHVYKGRRVCRACSSYRGKKQRRAALSARGGE